MISFKIFFLLAFDLQNNSSKKGNKNKKDKATNVQLKKKTLILTVVDKPEITFDAGNILGAIHIQYELIPNRCKYDVDVICWGPVAKISTNDGQMFLLTVIDKETAWVPICLEHYLEEMNISDIKLFHEHIIDFDLTTNTDKALSVIKAEKIIVNPENFKDNKKFSEIKLNPDSTIEVNDEESIRNFMRNIIMECINVPRKEVVSWLHLPCDCNVLYETIEKVSSGENVQCKDFALPCTPIQHQKRVTIEETGRKEVKTKPDKANAKKQKREKADMNENIKIKVPAEALFTDPNLSTYGLNNLAGFLKNAFIFLSVDRLLTRSQKLLLNPLVIKIKKLSHLPVEVLKSWGIESIHASYNIPNIAYCESVKKPPASKVVFNESHMHFSDTVSKIKLIEFMQTQKMFVEIYGNRSAVPVHKKISLFGQEDGDTDISSVSPNFKRFVPPDLTSISPVLLAVACYDVSSLIDNIWDFREIGQCHEPNTTLAKKPDEYFKELPFVDIKTVNETNLTLDYLGRRDCFLPEATLLEFGTTLQVEAYLMAPQAASLILHQIPNTFKRIFMIVNELTLAKNTLDDIMRHNERIFQKNPTGKTTGLMNSDIITGFVIDNGNNFFLYLEGPSTGFILNIWHEVVNCEVETCRIFFNTDNAFEQRLYAHFICEGMYVVTLRIPFHDILSKSGVYYKKKIPAPCLEALKKLGLLFQSSKYKCALQQNLLPTARELLSLDLEWGVPLRWKEKPEL